MIKIILLPLFFLLSAFSAGWAKCDKEIVKVEVPEIGQFTEKGPFNRMAPIRTKDGKYSGYRLIAIDKTFKAMSLQVGDAIHEVNGKAFDSQDSMIDGMDLMVSGRVEKKFCLVYSRKDQKFETLFHLVPKKE